MSCCIDLAVSQVGSTSRQVICLSTDGAPNSQSATMTAAANAEAAGIDELDAIAIGAGADVIFLGSIVFPQPGGFVSSVADFGEFANVFGQKLKGIFGIPTLSKWGFVILFLLLLAGTIYLRRQFGEQP